MALEKGIFAGDAWSSDTMRAELADPHGYYLVATTNEAIVAYAGLHAPVAEPQADIQTVAVAAEARHHGLGRTLMQSLITEATARGAAEIFLEVRADNPVARALYESLAFEAIAVRPRYYQPDGVDAIIMRHRIASDR